VSALRVLVVENTGERRLADAITIEPTTELVGVGATGLQAIALTKRLHPEAILISANVLGVNAFDATREIMTIAPTPVIVVFDANSTDAERVRVRARALEVGALAAVPHYANAFELIDLVRAMAGVKVVRRRPERQTHAPRPPLSAHAKRSTTCVSIGASTGGPAALRGIFAGIPAGLEAPILVTQHISTGFSEGMVSWWNAAGPLHAKIAEHGEPLRNGTIYLAPDEGHLTIADDYAIAISHAPPSGGHRPSASVMFRSAAERFGAGALAVILSGMGRDGVDGLEHIRHAGGIVCAQDEASCAVFGMPKAAIDAGVVDFILPLDAISRHIADAVASSLGPTS
jgi:two-component system, chemotaxis family, protein-glutamate methylesterase/glutaminase